VAVASGKVATAPVRGRDISQPDKVFHQIANGSGTCLDHRVTRDQKTPFGQSGAGDRQEFNP
jgi:hypothetical protein